MICFSHLRFRFKKMIFNKKTSVFRVGLNLGAGRWFEQGIGSRMAEK
jgi:hypothetical protein